MLQVVREGMGKTKTGKWRRKGVYWVPLLHAILWEYWTTPQATTGYSPAMQALGRELRLLINIGKGGLEITQRHEEV